MTEKETSTPRSERIKNYFIGIGALSGLILGLLAQFKGEPVAEKTWKTLRDQVNRQSEVINDLHTQMEVFRAIQEARTSLELEHELEELQKRYDALESAKRSSTPKSSRKPASRPKAIRKELEKEKLKRIEAELKQEQMVQDFIEFDMPEQKPLDALPESLEAAAKR